MKNVRLFQAFVGFVPRASVMIAGSLGLAALVMISSAMAQDAKPPKGTVMDGYNVHQSFDLGGHVANTTGSGSMYDTLVNLKSGPRILNHTLEMHALPSTKHAFFDTLYEGSTGYGGDPNDFTTLRMSKGKLYDFQGMFRRDRQYFDYDLLGNPLIPANDNVNVTATGGASNYAYTYPQVENAPHLFNTVRRMTDVNLTLLPVSKISFRAGYSQSINQGPAYSSVHLAGEGLLLQNWRNSTDTWLGGVNWKPIHGTMLTYEEHVTHYKGNTSLQIAGFNYQLANGTTVSLGYDAAPAASCYSTTSGLTNPPTTSGTCAGYIQYNRAEPSRTLFPTEEFRFQSSTLKNIQMTGRVLYTGANMNLPSYFEYFNGLRRETPTPVSLPQHTTMPGLTRSRVMRAPSVSILRRTSASCGRSRRSSTCPISTTSRTSANPRSATSQRSISMEPPR